MTITKCTAGFQNPERVGLENDAHKLLSFAQSFELAQLTNLVERAHNSEIFDSRVPYPT